MEIRDVEQSDIYSYPEAAMYFAKVVQSALTPGPEKVPDPPGMPKNISERVNAEAMDYAERVAAGEFERPSADTATDHVSESPNFAKEAIVQHSELSLSKKERKRAKRRRKQEHRGDRSPFYEGDFRRGDKLPVGQTVQQAVDDELEELMGHRVRFPDPELIPPGMALEVSVNGITRRIVGSPKPARSSRTNRIRGAVKSALSNERYRPE